jgi:hypothetical protein
VEALIQIVIWLARAAYKAYRKSQQGQAMAEADAAGETGELLSGAPPRQVTADPGLDSKVASFEGDLRQFTTPADPDRAILQRAASEALSPRVEQWSHQIKVAPDEAQATVPFELGSARRELAALQRIAAQRGADDRGVLLDRVDAVAMALYRPLLDFQQRRDLPLSTRHTAALVGEAGGSLTGALSRIPVAPIEVSVRLQHDVVAWPSIAREVGRDILLSLDGFEAELRRAAAFPDARPVDLTAGYLTEEHVVRSLGGWLTPLCADGIAALLLGPAYLAHLIALERIPDQPFKVRVVQVVQGHVAPVPPAELRVQMAAAVLERVGFAAEAVSLLDAWNQAHGADLEFYFPVGGGRYATLGEDFYLQPVRDLARVLCSEQVDALSGMHLLDVTDLHHSLGRQRQAEAVSMAFALGNSREEDPRAVVAGAALLGVEDPDQRVAALSLLQRSVVVESRARPTLDPIRRQLDRETLLSPDVIRDAMVLPRVLQRKGLSFGGSS